MIVSYLLLVLATATVHANIVEKYADLHTSFSAFLDISEEATWTLLDQNGHKPGTEFQKICDENMKLHRNHLDNIFGVKAADNAAALLEVGEEENTAAIQSQTVFDLHDAVLDAREHYADHAKSLADHIGAKALKKSETLVTSLVNLGESTSLSLSSDGSSETKSAGWRSFVKFMKRLAQGFLAVMKAIATLIRRVLDSTYLGGGASVSTLTGPAPTINIEFSAGDLFVNSADADPANDETDEKTNPNTDLKGKYEWSVGEFGPACPADPCSVSRPVIQMRFVRCMKMIEGQKTVEADSSNCKGKKSPDTIQFCPKCPEPKKKKGKWLVIWDSCNVPCGLGTRSSSVRCVDPSFEEFVPLPNTQCPYKTPPAPPKKRVCLLKKCS